MTLFDLGVLHRCVLVVPVSLCEVRMTSSGVGLAVGQALVTYSGIPQKCNGRIAVAARPLSNIKNDRRIYTKPAYTKFKNLV